MLDLEDCTEEIRMWFCRFFAEISDECRGKTVASSPRAVTQQIPQTAKFHICAARIGMEPGDATRRTGCKLHLTAY